MKNAFLVLLLAHGLVGTSHAQIFVDHSATGANDGSSWANAFTSLQDGIIASAPGNGSNLVFVAQGSYFPDEGSTQTNGDRDATFTLKDNVSVLGGFAPGDDLVDRDPTTKITILSGDIDQNPATSSTANSHHVVTANNVGNGAVLDGVTVRDGDATTVNPQEGGGILCINFGSASFRNCIIEDNTADNGGAVNVDDSFPNFTDCLFRNNSCSSRGGAIRVESGADPTLVRCTFRNNTANDGGAIQASGSTTDYLVRDCLFEDNTANNDGGAINTSTNTPEISNCTFRRNHATDDGGALRYSGRVNTISGCIFEENTADELGGAVRLLNDLTLDDCTFTNNTSNRQGGAIHTSGSGSEFFLTNCTLNSNSSLTRNGGAVSNDGNPATITNCVFTSNTSPSNGGAIINDDCDAVVSNCLFEGNTAGSTGGAVANILSSRPTYTNCAFSGNFATGRGGALRQNGSSVTLLNCTFQSNASNSFGGGASLNGIATITNCLFWNNSSANATTTRSASIDLSTTAPHLFSHTMAENFSRAVLDTIGSSPDTNFDSTDPLFALEIDPLLAPTTGSDLRLQTASPFIDAGDGTANTTTTDLLGNPRKDNLIDLGAIETLDLSLFVDASATGTNTGEDFTNAFLTLSDALSASVPGSVIHIAEGTYIPSYSGDRTATFTISNDIQILGGFPAGNGNPDSNPVRNPVLHPTILSGDLNGNDMAGNNRSDNSFHVVTFSSAGVTTRVDGISITGGQADGPNPEDQQGGGILFSNSSPVLTHLIIADNHSSSTGGGAHIPTSSNPDIESCQFHNNSASSGAGLSANASAPTLTSCSFNDNKASLNGGAVLIENTATPLFTTCTFESNSAEQAGGAILTLTASPTFSGCGFSANSAFSGGSIFNDNADPVLNNCTFRNNNATNGGAFANSNGSTSQLTSCLFETNTATDGGAFFNDASQPTLLACLLNGNTADRGGAIFNTSSPAPTFTNSVCQGNLANDSGGAIFNLNSSPTFINLSVQGNAATVTGGALLESGTSSPQYFNCVVWDNIADRARFNPDSSQAAENTAAPTFFHSLIQGRDLSSSNNNLDGTDFSNDPKFIIPIDPFLAPQCEGSLIPRFDSAVLDLGDDSANPTVIDLNGSPRKSNAIDLGAFEHQGIIHVYLSLEPFDPSWPNRETLLSVALRNAVSGHTIFVARGTHTPRNELNVPDASASFPLPEGVEIYGGFEVGDDFEDRDPRTKRTFLSGSDLSHHVVRAQSSSHSALLDGFTVRRGNADGVEPVHQTGAGLLCNGASPRIKNCTFDLNQAILGGAGARFTNDSRPEFTHCSFLDNTSLGNGAGILAEGSQPRFTSCEWLDNESTGGAGGAVSLLDSDATFNFCKFRGNSAGTSGGGSHHNQSSPAYTDCLWSGNASNKGGAIANEASAPSLFNVTIQGNAAANTGGAISNSESTPRLINSIIWHNTANEDRTTSTASIENTSSTPLFTNCLIENFSRAALDGSGASNGNLDPSDPLFLGEADPLQSPTSEQPFSYHLRPTSPAIDSGSNTVFPGTSFVDLQGNSHAINNQFDLGAFEHQGFLFVDENASGSNSGSSWEDAYNNLQDALAEAPGHFVLIAEGSYSPDEFNGIATNNKDASFDLADNQIFGGFQSGDAFPDRSPINHPTLLSGELSSRNSRKILALADSAAHLEGVIVADGRDTVDLGGGLVCSNSLLTAIDVTFESNVSGDGGGGASISNDSKTRFTGCRFADNTANGGGSLLVQNSTALLENTFFEQNRSTNLFSGGGAVRCREAVVTFNRCEFRSNSALSGNLGGGAAIAVDSQVDFTNCLFRGNRAGQNSSGSLFSPGPGGAIALYDSTGSTINCLLQGNLASNGGASFFSNSPFTITNCTFQGNAAAFDIFSDTRDTSLEQPLSGLGGAIHINGSAPSFTNCIIWRNSADFERDSQTASIEFDNTLIDPQLLPLFSHCLVENFTPVELDTLPGSTSNLGSRPPFFFLEIDPFLVNDFSSFLDTRDTASDLRLLPGSSAIDAGDNTGNSIPSDLLNSPRIQNTTINLGAIEDLGPNLGAIFDTDNDNDGLPFGIENAIDSNPDLADFDSPNRPSLSSVSDIPGFSFGFNEKAESYTTWIVERSTNLTPNNFQEIFRFEGPTQDLSIDPNFVINPDPTNITIFDISNPLSPQAFFRLKIIFAPSE